MPQKKKQHLPPVERQAQDFREKLTLEEAQLKARIRVLGKPRPKNVTPTWVKRNCPLFDVEWAKKTLEMTPGPLKKELVVTRVKKIQTYRPAYRKGQHKYSVRVTRAQAIKEIGQELGVKLQECDLTSQRSCGRAVTAVGMPFRQARKRHAVKIMKKNGIYGLDGRAESPYSQGKKLRGGEFLLAPTRDAKTGRFGSGMSQGRKGDMHEAFKWKREANAVDVLAEADFQALLDELDDSDE